MKQKKQYLIGALLCIGLLCGCAKQEEPKEVAKSETKEETTSYAYQDEFVALGQYKGLTVDGHISTTVTEDQITEQMKKLLAYASGDDTIEVTEENVKKYVQGTDSVEDFKKQVKQNLAAGSSYEDYQYNLQQLIGEIYRNSKLISSETEFYEAAKEAILTQHEGDAKVAGYADLEEYSKACGYETKEAFENEFVKKEVDEYLKSEYVMRAIRDAEGLNATKEQVETLITKMETQQGISREEAISLCGGESGVQRQADLQNVYEFLLANNTIQ